MALAESAMEAEVLSVAMCTWLGGLVYGDAVQTCGDSVAMNLSC
jgi:hypothetical protein